MLVRPALRRHVHPRCQHLQCSPYFVKVSLLLALEWVSLRGEHVLLQRKGVWVIKEQVEVIESLAESVESGESPCAQLFSAGA